MSLYLKYRPDSFSQIRGNAEILQTLESMLSDLNTCPHTFLLHGETGTGKTTLARIIANELGCVGNDYREINTADFRGIDSVRDMINSSQFHPMEGTCRVWVLDEIQKMTGEAQNALLKILEDTPKHVYFILCTTDPQKLLATIKGRCQQFQTKLLSEQEMFGLLRRVVHSENEELSKEIYDQIIQDSLGHPRNALQILEQVLNTPKDKRLEIAKQGAEQQTQAIELCRALLKETKWKPVADILVGLKDQDAEGIRRMVLGYCQAVLLNGKDDAVCGLIMEEFRAPFYDIGTPGLTLACYSVIKNK